MNHVALTSSESKIRLTAFFVLLFILTYLITRNPWLILFLLIDFSFRSTPELAKYSPLANLSGLISKTFRLANKPVYMPPKRFAARIGLLFIITIIIAQNSKPGTLILGSTIALFAALESLAGFCTACWIYSAFMRLRSH
ncbi:MAG TPA: DUF4395 domain-containing protein [Puia sp.]|jgi:hypothetical protein|nr:DUF4395 domain-containing protein [Puia sp.]